ncbi:MAG: hypothetical protein WCE79_01030 [Xanthobacteraceae bacterium]
MERQSAEVAKHLADLTIGMIRMARDAKLDTLVYLLRVVHLEASQVQKAPAAPESEDEGPIPAKASSKRRRRLGG